MVNKIYYYFLALLFTLALILGGIIFYNHNFKHLKVIFFDVGQGDAILIAEGQNQILIDGGRNGKLLLENLGKYIPFWDRQIEIIVATHPDADHIGGLIEAVKNYKIGAILETGVSNDSRVYENWKNIKKEKKIEEIKAVRGMEIKFPQGAIAQVFYPENETEFNNSNENSIVLKLTFGENKFLFTGDLPKEQETILLQNRLDLNSQVLKIAHHGSKYSTSDDFLKAVQPLEAVISVSKNNIYGHPSPEVLEKLERNKILILRTDELKDIIYQCKNINEKCQKIFSN